MNTEKNITSQNWNTLFVAWLIALVATLAALFIGEVMGQKPCILCWYQRIFMFPLPVLLGIALYRHDYSISNYALPLSIGGGLIAGFHSLLYFGLIPEGITPCDADLSCADAKMTIFGGVPLPLLALTAFTSISFFLLTLQRRLRP